MIFAYVSIFLPGVPHYRYHIYGLTELERCSELIEMSKLINLSLRIVFITLVSPYSIIICGNDGFICKQIMYFY